MTKLLSFSGFLVITFGFVECPMMAETGLKPNEFLITGKLVDWRDVKSQVHDFDVKVTYGNEETGIKELVSGTLANGEFELRGTLELPKVVSLSIVRGGDTLDVTEFKLLPNSKVNVEVLVITRYNKVSTSSIYDRWKPKVGVDYTYVYLKGFHHASTVSESKFTITGDLSNLGDIHPELTIVWIGGRTDKLDGTRTHTDYGTVLLDNGKFLIEGDIDEPTGVSIGITGLPHFGDRYAILTAILEPGVNYEIGTLENTEEFVVLADRDGIHSKLITDWQSDPEHLELLEQRTLAIEEYKTTLNSEEGSNQEVELKIEDKEEIFEETSTSSTFASKSPPTDECKHVDLTSVPDYPSSVLPMYPWEKLSYKIQDRKTEYFLPFIQNDDDLHLAWLAYQLSSLDWGRGDDPVFGGRHSDGTILYHSFTYELDKQKIVVLEELATKFSPEFVSVHITPRIEAASRRIALDQNNKKVIPGQLAPPFTLFTRDGESVSLHGVLKENELVLVNFWDKWCDLCVASVPALKEVYSQYHDEGFEIITVHFEGFGYPSIRDVEENDYPWIDVIDSEDSNLKGWEAPIKTSYTVPGLGLVYETAYDSEPNGFLIDNEGCIVRRDLSTEELESVLASRWSKGSAE